MTDTHHTTAAESDEFETTADSVIEGYDIDPVTLQVIGGELDTIAAEMATNLIRSSYSSIIRESEDMGAGIFTADSRELCESDSTPMHVGSLVGYINGMYETFEERGVERDEVIGEGDVFIHNHPHYGASHSPDIAVAVPVFYEGEHVAWAANTAHHLDIGSATPGLAIDLEDMYAEGTLFRATKVYDEGERVDEIWNLLRDNVRTPREVIGDLQAQISSARAGRDRYLELIDKYGLETVQETGDALMDYAEALLREEIKQIPDGTYHAADWLDDDGRNRGERLKIDVEITVEGSDITVDLSGSADQTDTAYNVPFHGSTDVVTYFTIRSILMDTYTHDEYLPQNSGTFRPIHPKAREGCMFNPTPPTAAFARINQVDKMSDLIIQALAEAIRRRSAPAPAVRCTSSATAVPTRTTPTGSISKSTRVPTAADRRRTAWTPSTRWGTTLRTAPSRISNSHTRCASRSTTSGRTATVSAATGAATESSGSRSSSPRPS